MFGILQLDNLRAMILGATITQPFGPSTLSGEPTYDGYQNFHRGIDFVLPGGTSAVVAAPASGRVLFAGNDGNGFGNYVKILAPNGYTYIIGHLNDLNGLLYGSGRRIQNIQTGDLVHAGDLLGHQGATGYATGNHVHLEIINPMGQPVDPGGGPSTPGGTDYSVSNLFYTLYHDLGFGAGLVSGQVNQVPDPLTGGAWAMAVPSVLPTNPNARDRRYYAGRGFLNSAYPGEGMPNMGDPGTVTGTPLGYNPGSGSTGTFFGVDVAGILRFLLIGGMGVALIIVGVVKLGHEGPVQTVVQPVGQAAGSVKRTAGKLALLAA